MRYFFTILLFVILFPPSIAQDIPTKPTKSIFVSDFANMLSQGDEMLLQQKLKNYNDSTSTQIAVVIIESLNGADLEDYAQKLAETWGIGQKGKDNGILLLISKNDRKIRIHTGYGIEDKIPDGLAKKIIDNELTPSFRTGQFYVGINKAIDTMIGLLSGSFSPDSLYVDTTGIWIGRVFIYVPFFFTLIFILNTGFRKSQSDMLIYAISIGGGLILSIFLLEAWAYPYKHDVGFWLLAVIVELTALITYAKIQGRRNSINFRYNIMKQSLESEKVWNKLKRLYGPGEVDEARADIREQFLPLRNAFQDEERIRNLYKEFRKVNRELNNKIFTRRNEYALIILADKLEKDKFFEQDIFEKGSLELAKAKLYDALSYFEKKSFETLSAEDRQKLNTDLDYFKKIQDEPEKLLLPDKAWISKVCDDFMDSPKSWVFSAYTSASIKKTKEKFKKDYEKAKANGQAIDYYYFYVHKVKKIQNSPSKFLIRKPTTSSSSSYSSGGSSFSSSSSSSSFGGGSFGGGGASGGW